MEIILSGDNINEGRIKINNLSGLSSLWSAGTGNYSIVGNDLLNNVASNQYSFAGGSNSISSGDTSFSFGNNVIAGGDYSFVFGENNKSINNFSFAGGKDSISSGITSFAFGEGVVAGGNYSFSNGFSSKTIGDYSTSKGALSTVESNYSYSSIRNGTLKGDYSFVSSCFFSNPTVTIDSSNSRSAYLGGFDRTENTPLPYDDVVYVSKLNIDNISDDNSLANVLTLESNDYINQKEYNFSSISLTSTTSYGSSTAILLQPNNHYFINNSTSNDIFRLKMNSTNGDIIKITNISSEIRLGIQLVHPYSLPSGVNYTYIALGTATASEIDAKRFLKVLPMTEIELTYFEDLNTNNQFWLVTNLNTTVKNYSDYDYNNSTESFDDYLDLYFVV
tara:strand:- start:229 stop:1401 length:1173 start_codon:yes stop_codon:yes gene_type:complete